VQQEGFSLQHFSFISMVIDHRNRTTLNEIQLFSFGARSEACYSEPLWRHLP